MMRAPSVAGKPTASSTITIVTRPACGIPAAPTLAAVAVMLGGKHKKKKKLKSFAIQRSGGSFYLTATTFPNEKSTARNWAMKIAATASYNAVPSMLIWAPTGITNLVTRGSRPSLSRVCIVRGRVAELERKTRRVEIKARRRPATYLDAVPKAVTKTWLRETMNRNGSVLVQRKKITASVPKP